jgi:hypothetical protein
MMMKAAARQSRKWNSLFMIGLPLIFMVFLGSQMALRQVSRKSAVYQEIPEITQAAALRRLPSGTKVMLRGRLVRDVCLASTCGTDSPEPNLIVYQERPADGRAVRFQEVFDQHFPAMELAMSDGRVQIVPRPESAYIMQHAPHVVATGDRQRIGFRPGDMVTVQGRWQPNQAAALPMLTDVTGIMGIDRAALFAAWHSAVRQVTWVSYITGLLSVAGLLTLVLRVWKLQLSH